MLLKRKLELLKRKLELLKRKLELLKRKLELLKRMQTQTPQTRQTPQLLELEILTPRPTQTHEDK
jgi:hypothetical protein